MAGYTKIGWFVPSTKSEIVNGQNWVIGSQTTIPLSRRVQSQVRSKLTRVVYSSKSTIKRRLNPIRDRWPRVDQANQLWCSNQILHTKIVISLCFLLFKITLLWI